MVYYRGFATGYPESHNAFNGFLQRNFNGLSESLLMQTFKLLHLKAVFFIENKQNAFLNEEENLEITFLSLFS